MNPILYSTLTEFCQCLEVSRRQRGVFSRSCLSKTSVNDVNKCGTDAAATRTCWLSSLATTWSLIELCLWSKYYEFFRSMVTRPRVYSYVAPAVAGEVLIDVSLFVCLFVCLFQCLLQLSTLRQKCLQPVLDLIIFSWGRFPSLPSPPPFFLLFSSFSSPPLPSFCFASFYPPLSLPSLPLLFSPSPISFPSLPLPLKFS